MTLWTRWQLVRDHLLGRYVPFTASSPAERDACLAVIDAVRRTELHRVDGESALDTAAFGGAEVDDELVGVRDRRTGAVVGAVRATPAGALCHIPTARREYCLDRLGPAIVDRCWVSTRLAVLPAYRKTAASLALLRHMYADGLRRGGLATLLTCEPNLLPTYTKMGARPLGPAFPSHRGGFRVPLVIVFHDEEHLARVGSPLGAVLAASPGPHPAEAVRWQRGLAPVAVGTAPYDPERGAHEALCSGISDAGRAALLRNAWEVDCRPGDRVLGAGDGSPALGFVITGRVDVAQGGRAVATLGPGAFFGEMSHLLDGVRTADIIAATPGTQVVLLSPSALGRLEDPADVAALYQTLAQAIAARLAATAPAAHAPLRAVG